MISSIELSDLEEIRTLKADYFFYADHKQWDGFRLLFCPSATFFFPEVQEAALGLDDAMEFIVEFLRNCVSIHHGYLPQIKFVSTDSATGTWAMEDRLFWIDSSGPGGIASLHGFGHYHETYERHGGRWLFKTLRLTRLRLTTVPALGPTSYT